MQIYVGNLNLETSEQTLRTLFSMLGEVLTARIVRDRETGRSRGFAFVQMANHEKAAVAVRELDGQELDRRRLRVNLAKPNGF